MSRLKRKSILFSSSLALLIGGGALHAKGKKRQHKYVGQHPLSINTDDGYCYLEVPHVHATPVPARHKALYRDHRGHSHFIADPQPYGYDGEQHSYYGHHPIAVEVVLESSARYESGQQLEYCYLDGPHYHAFEPQAGLTFEVKGGAQWYVGELPAAYVEARPRYAKVNRVYATVEVERPVVEFDVPPVGYVGPVLEVHIDGHGHRGNHGHGHVDAHVDVGVHVQAPSIEIGFGLPGVAVYDDRGRKHKKHKKHKKFKGKRRKSRGLKFGHRR